jgi:hypothetical protein
MDFDQCPAIAPFFGFLGVAASTVFASEYIFISEDREGAQ